MGNHNVRTYSLAQRFFRFTKPPGEVHNVPRYTTTSIMELVEILNKKFDRFRDEVFELENNLNGAKQNVINIKYQMEVQKFEQDQYFEKEKNILEQIATSASNVWEWNTKHR